jgi:hypothetical protein
MSNPKPQAPDVDKTPIRAFLVVEIAGPRRDVQRYAEYLQIAVEADVMFLSSGWDLRKKRPVVNIHEVKFEEETC